MTDEDGPYAEIIARLTARRKALMLSQQDVATLAQIQQSQISACERGVTTRPGWEFLVKWAKALRMKVRVGMILDCPEYAEPYFADLTPKVAEMQTESPRPLKRTDLRP